MHRFWQIKISLILPYNTFRTRGQNQTTPMAKSVKNSPWKTYLNIKILDDYDCVYFHNKIYIALFGKLSQRKQLQKVQHQPTVIHLITYIFYFALESDAFVSREFTHEIKGSKINLDIPLLSRSIIQDTHLYGFIWASWHDSVPLVQFKKRKKHAWMSVTLVKLQAKACNFTISNNSTLVFSTFF